MLLGDIADNIQLISLTLISIFIDAAPFLLLAVLLSSLFEFYVSED